MKKILSILMCSLFIFIFSFQVRSQGCVAIRSTGGQCTMDYTKEEIAKPHTWVLNVNNRYFKSFRHFVGTKEQKQRVEQETEVINHAYSLDISLTRNINKRWSLAIALPILSNARSSLYEHDGKTRHSTHSFGIGDIRVSAYRWMIDPEKMSKVNIQLGVGIKLPTGDYKYQDFFYKNDSTNLLGPIDQSIQLGDGGTGFTTELNAYYNLSKHVSVYGNLYYLINPREQNGTSTARGAIPSATSVRFGSSTMSVPDQYMIRAGANITARSLTLSLGLRDECIPVRDLIGGSRGFRRPGYIISLEPGITYNYKNLNLYAYVPVALKRSRTQSIPDKIRTGITGVYAQGDAAFADYSVNVGFTRRF